MADFLLKSTFFVSLLALVTAHALSAAPWQAMLIVLALAVPGFLAGAYDATVHRIRVLEVFDRRGWVRWLLASPWLRLLAWGVWALVNALVLLVQFQRLDGLGWVVLILMVPAFWAGYRAIGANIAPQVKPYFRRALTLAVARRVTPVLAVLIYATLRLALDDAPAYFASLQEAIAAQATAPAKTAIVTALSQVAALWSGVEAYGLGRVGAWGRWGWIGSIAILALGSWVQFYAVCLAISSLLIPRSEYARMFGRLSAAEVAPPVGWGRKATISALAVFVVGFIYFPAFLKLEQQIRTEPQVARVAFERILWRVNTWYVQEGTIATLERLPLVVAQGRGNVLSDLRGAVDQGFGRLTENVDPFLDWYFSLSAEYARLVALSLGNADDHISQKMEEMLAEGDPFRDLQTALDTAIAESGALRAEYVRAATQIIVSNRVEIAPGEEVEIVREGELADILITPELGPLIDVSKNAMDKTAIRGVAGAASGAAVAAVTGKVAAKGIIKVLGKVAVGKIAGGTGGATAGALVGGAIGSVVPIVGTAFGAVVGGAIGGIVMGVAVDAGLLALDDALNRDDIRNEILAAIEATRLETLAGLEPRGGADR